MTIWYPKTQTIAAYLIIIGGLNRAEQDGFTYTFPEVAIVQTTTVYWFDDQPWGGCKLPKTGKYITRMLQAIGLFENIQNTINARMWKHSSTHPTINSHDYRVRDHQQRNTENETTHLRHQEK